MTKNIPLLFLLVLVIVSQIKCHEDYYKLMGVEKSATEQEIKRAFRRQSAKYHPDRNQGDESAKEMYLKINSANDVLSNKQKRYIYDTRGVEAIAEFEKNQHMEEQGYHGAGMRTGPNYQVQLQVTLEDLYKGTEKEYKLQRNIICEHCRGTGAKDGLLKQCTRCHGSGHVVENVRVGMGFTMQMQNKCKQCGGSGKLIQQQCHKCGGKKVHPESKTFLVNIEQGMTDGQKIVFEGESEQHPDFLPGDIVFYIQCRNHGLFKRVGNDLHTQMTLTMKEALLGFKRTIKHLDGHIVNVEVEGTTQPFSTKIIQEEGMPLHNVPSTKGDLHIKFYVRLPRVLHERNKELVKKMFK